MRSPIVLAAALLSSAAAATAQQTPIDDADVSQAVEREFVLDFAVPDQDVSVAVSNGIVTLDGAVSNLLARERAVRLAETVRGVRSVVDLVEVEPSPARTDSAIAHDVSRALLVDPATDSYEVTVAVDHGEVTLTGTVDSWAEKQLAGSVAKGVAGVTGLRNDLTVDRSGNRPDTEIRQDVVQALRFSPLVDDGLVSVTVRDGNVILSGTVGSSAEKREAYRLGWTAGVRSVSDSTLDVARWARDPDLRKEKYVIRPDDDIRRAIEAAFVRDPRVFSFDVTPEVTVGVVTLRGVVDNLKAKRAAESDARNTVGVRSVENRIAVRPVIARADSLIRSDVAEALSRDPWVERYDIGITVMLGTVYLNGTVDSWLEKAQADDVASRVPGVTLVVNQLDVRAPQPFTLDPWVDPWNVSHFDWTSDLLPSQSAKDDFHTQRDIERQLFWSPFVTAADVKVAVTDGVATLTGSVGSVLEKEMARENAYDGGARWVINLLRVDES